MAEGEAGIDASRRKLVGNERRKLAAGALDRLSTAFLAVGGLGQVLSLKPESTTMRGLAVFGRCSWAQLSYIGLDTACLEG